MSSRRPLSSALRLEILFMFVPFGTVLGVFTIIVLSKESVQKLYENPLAPPSSQSPTQSVTPPSGQEERQP